VEVVKEEMVAIKVYQETRRRRVESETVRRSRRISTMGVLVVELAGVIWKNKSTTSSTKFHKDSGIIG
jgi:hypothetical protein